MSCSLLSGLSDRELLGRLKSLVEKERATTVEILLHLNEVERRRLYLSQGYPSLFDYCTRHLGYSSSAAGRRISAARCVRDHPEVLGLLERNEVTLVTVSRAASVLTGENRRDLLGRLRKKSEREVEEVLSTYRPPVAYRDRVKPVSVAVAASPGPQGPGNSGHVCPITPSGGSTTAGGSAAGPPRACTEKGALLRASTGPGVSQGSTEPRVSHALPGVSPGSTPAAVAPASTQANASSPATERPRLERRLLVQFLASEAFMEKFERARALLSNRLEENSFEKVFEATIDEYIERHSPERKNARREKRKTRRHGGVKLTKKAKTPGESRPEPAKAPVPIARKTDPSTRRIPAALRDRVFERDNGRCTFIAKTGERCNATHGLQIDHIVPYARGGKSTPENLRLLCGKHNRLEAERVYGANAIRRYRMRE